MAGKLYGVGVGPGDPELLTVKAFRILQQVPVISYPQKQRTSSSYAKHVVSAYISPDEKEMLGLNFPMTKDARVLLEAWLRAANEIDKRLRAGKDVAFITEGDPLLYSTFIHLMQMVKEVDPEIFVEIVPGVSSINGVAARLRIPLADGDDRIAIIPATTDIERMRHALYEHETVVFLKVAKVIDLLHSILQELNLLEKAYVVTKATSAEEVIWKMDQLPDQLPHVQMGYLTTMVVKK